MVEKGESHHSRSGKKREKPNPRETHRWVPAGIVQK
jgi:hypothetical protein